MTLTLFMSMLTSFYLISLLNSNPLMLMLIIIFISLTMSLTFSVMLSSWYAFFIFLIYVGGMLVMFAYFAATTPNQANMKVKMSMYLIPLFTFILFTPLSMMNAHIAEAKYDQLLTLFSSNESWMLILLTMVLLLTMLIVVKITMRSKGPMRSFM